MSQVSPVHLAYNVYLPDEGFKEELNPIIFLHGITGSKEHFDDQSKIAANATKRKVYAVDARNHGDSEWSENFNFDINADDILSFMDDMGIKKAIIVGHSMGGVTAIKAALRNPDKIEKIVVEDIGVKDVAADILDIVLMIVEIYQAAAETLPPEVDESEAKQLIVKFLSSELLKKPKHILEKFSRVVGKGTESFRPDFIRLRRKEDGKFTFAANLRVIARLLKNKESIMSPPQGHYLGPACFIFGDVSLFDVGGEKDEIKKYFPKATFVAIEGATHTVHMDKPEEFNSELLQFLS